MNGKSVHLVGGVPKFDLTVMDFDRWGMHGAAPRLRQVLHDGMNIMDRCEIYAKPVAGREHHKDWFQDIDHPDMRLMAAAPELLSALQALMKAIGGPLNSAELDAAYNLCHSAISKTKGGAA
jgi:hypothetical protein